MLPLILTAPPAPDRNGTPADFYPYLSSCFALVVIFLVCVALFPSQRRPMLVCAVGAAPAALLSVSFVPVYWTPVRVAEFFVGPEDVAFSFATGGLMWLLATRTLWGELRLHWRPRTFLRRYFTAGPLFVLLFYVGRRAGLEPMAAALAGMALLGLVVVYRRPGLWRMAILGGAGFGLLHTIVVAASFAMWPHFAMQWDGAGLSGLLIWTVPFEEVAWAVASGAVFPMVMAYALDAEVRVRSIPGTALAARAVVDPVEQ